MRPRFLISLFVLFAAVLAIMLWLRPKQHAAAPISAQQAIQPTNQPMRNGNGLIQNTPHAPSQGIPSANQQSAVPRKVETPEQARARIESVNVPIDFYGQVIDEDSNALAGVSIEMSIRHWTMPDLSVPVAGSTEIYITTNSDANGRFEIHGKLGDGVYIESIKKSGYDLEPGQSNFGTTSGSYDNPVIFKMWSTNIHERLIAGDKAFDIVPDGRPYFINLTTGTISESESGDLRVWIQYTNRIVRGQLYDWSTEIDVIGGGLLGEPLGSAMYEAPTAGYLSSFESRQQIKGGQRGQTGQHQFYLQLESGQEYGQMTIDLLAPFNDETPGLVSLSYAINPSGSRILR